MRRLLIEARQVEDLIGIFSKKFNFGHKAKADLQSLVLADPTEYENDRGKFAGKYATWIGNLFVAGKIKADDTQELRSALNTYNINKSQIGKPITDFHTLDELVQEVSKYSDDFKADKTISKGERDLEKVYEDEYVTIYVPHTWEAARKIGGDTQWCTACSSDYFFDSYKNQYGGEYYDIIRKSDGAKFQLHPESNEFMDYRDCEVNFGCVFNSEKEASGTINFLTSIGKNVLKWAPKSYFDEVDEKLRKGVPPKEIFDEINEEIGGFRVVKLNGKKNYITKDNKLLSPYKWFNNAQDANNGLNGVGDFINGFALVMLDNGRLSFISTEGKIIDNNGFKNAEQFNNGFAKVKLDNGKWSFINTDGDVINSDGFVAVGNFYRGFAQVLTENGKLVFINNNGQLCDNFFKPIENYGLTSESIKYTMNEFCDNNPGIDEIKPSEVNVKDFKNKGKLNKSFWKDDKLDSRIRLRLLDLADDFIKELNIKWVKPEDIVFTGSLANYNWHNQSDIDVHIMMNYKKIHENFDFVKSYINSKKEMWANEHDTLTIKGFPVEMYVEDTNSETDPSGAYSLNKGEWIRKPIDSNDVKFNENLVRRKAAKYITKIDDLCDEIDRETDRHKSEVLSKKLEGIFEKLKNFRKDGLNSSKKEMSTGNILWKVIKHHGSIKKLWDKINKSYDLINSIDECKIV